MEIPAVDITWNSEAGRKAATRKFQHQMQDRFNQLKADISERPFLYAALAFVAGFVANTFPAKLLFLVIVRLLSWLLGPALLVMGVVKLSDLFFSPGSKEPTVAQRP
jgi:hypothetical protein